MNLVEECEVQRRRQSEDVFSMYLQLFRKEVQDKGTHRLFNLKAHCSAEATPVQLFLHRGQKVLCIILFDLEILITRDTEGICFLNFNAGEEVVEVSDNQLFDRQERCTRIASNVLLHAPFTQRSVNVDEARQSLWNADTRKVPLSGHGVLQNHRNVQ